ncbi:RNA polymerase sigma-54 factor [Bordetella holmesii 30539]|uniref:RNA polymerase sigma-54 factor n=1 Tax=Bordetella holmesii 1058 TaxID=1247648 RepID=A0ABN0S361_9BORD|nr:RNA polymerase sigma-54 factor [Bordetella holmesii ATCC 51541]AIT26182.1 RNA polymerase sigma-54 factor [Bordetella holmesii 44057]AMD45241.1 RNA polymerase sigma-54 factor [Bordetella holmesii H558]AOB34128.1 RNA polymerase sigma-54 factor [Bordetella holmesii]EWM44018.1 RNA polymerase sigma-54 factor [Bordetella holmesii 41130]EWM46754.1 RNA polymerase sigma-54 factor [Bordetella holmesii 35009]EWM50921.1 RNA polymerase sigma-54 factor [Bordetella holmesii 70147]EXF89786.1 RNA polymera
MTLTPQLQQSIRLLQLSSLDLEAEISQALAENPLLERDETPAEQIDSDPQREASLDTADSVTDTEIRFDDMPGSGGVYPDEDSDSPARSDTLREHLLQQLALTRAGVRDAALAALLIDELDDNGYLGSPLSEILQWLPAELEVDEDELRAALSLVQSFDPTGIGARDMAECLLLQLRHPDVARLPEAASPAVLGCARELCGQHLALLATGNPARLREMLRVDEATLRAARALIVRLEPRPGRAWTVPAAEYAVPDVLVRKTRQGWQAVLNSAVMPRLQVNGLYAQMLSNQREAAYAGLNAQLQQARWMIRNVEQRFDTILRVAQAIVAHRAEFFTRGPAAMRPLILKDIAGELGLHESTISRATTQKYMLTPFGTMELKRFFGTGVAMDSGDSASATAVQEHIRQMVADENRAKPLSDSQIMERLAGQGIVIARRTVAKYREALRIAPAAVRKAQAAAR